MSEMLFGGENGTSGNEPGTTKPVGGDAHDTYLVFDGDGNVWDATLRCCDLLGLRQDDILDGGLLKLLPEKDRQLLLDLVKSASGQPGAVNWAGMLRTGRGEIKLRLILEPLAQDTSEGTWVKCRVCPFTTSEEHKQAYSAQPWTRGATSTESLQASGSNRRDVRRRTNDNELAHLLQQQRTTIIALEQDLQIRKGVEDRLVARMAEIEEALAKRKQELKRANMDLTAIGKLVHNALGTPIRKMESTTRAALSQMADNLPAQVRAYLETTLELTMKEHRLLDQVTLFALVGSEPVTNAQVDMEALFAEVGKELMEDMGGECHATIHVGKLASCVSDVRLLRLVIEQLLSNGIRFSSGKHAVIDVSCYEERGSNGSRRTKQYVWVVRDNGIGFPSSRAHRLFTPGVVLHERGALSGAGIGLATARRAIERLGGRIWAEGQEGEGASFHFCIHNTD